MVDIVGVYRRLTGYDKDVQRSTMSDQPKGGFVIRNRGDVSVIWVEMSLSAVQHQVNARLIDQVGGSLNEVSFLAISTGFADARRRCDYHSSTPFVQTINRIQVWLQITGDHWPTSCSTEYCDSVIR